MKVICLYYQNTSKSIVINRLFFLMGLKSVMEMKGSRINPPLSLSLHTMHTCVMLLGSNQIEDESDF